MAGFLTFLTPIRDLFFKENDPKQAYAILARYLNDRKLSAEEKRAVYELAGLILRAQKKYDDAIRLYSDIKDPYQAGYCEMLKGNLPSARNYWTRTISKPEGRENNWSLTLFGMISRQLQTYPTSFQVRNHIEADIHNLITAMQFDYLENLLSYADFLIQINPESYKFLGRSLMHSGWVDRASEYLLKGQKTLPNDPEIYFHLGEYSEKKELFEDARIMLHQCLLISPTYQPAKDILKRLPTP